MNQKQRSRFGLHLRKALDRGDGLVDLQAATGGRSLRLADLVVPYIGIGPVDVGEFKVDVPGGFGWVRDLSRRDAVRLDFTIPVNVQAQFHVLRINSDLNAIEETSDYYELFMDKWQFPFNIKLIRDWSSP